uniref:Uncharacterized protein n=1 Tax=Physcomitrium patens TaxID=3218 RepID=A0A2K1K271_PHYPA|nr:hypothetical protein PHYPA_012346 [Physcomitrium patens]
MIKGVKLPNSTLQQLIFQYAKDTSFMVKIKRSFVSNLIRILDTFNKAFGLIIN